VWRLAGVCQFVGHSRATLSSQDLSRPPHNGDFTFRGLTRLDFFRRATN